MTDYQTQMIEVLGKIEMAIYLVGLIIAFASLYNHKS